MFGIQKSLKALEKNVADIVNDLDEENTILRERIEDLEERNADLEKQFADLKTLVREWISIKK